jgi:hypothetical protein
MGQIEVLFHIISINTPGKRLSDVSRETVYKAFMDSKFGLHHMPADVVQRNLHQSRPCSNYLYIAI